MRCKLIQERLLVHRLAICFFIVLLTNLVCLPFVQSSFAIELNISPLTVYIEEQTSVSTLSIMNTADVPAVIQLSAAKWEQQSKDQSMNNSYTKTNDLLIYPPTLSIEPKTKKIVRIGLRSPKVLSHEQAYLLYMQEVPIAKSVNAVVNNKVVNVVLNVSIPMFVVPKNTKNSLIWSLSRINSKQLKLQLHNAGNTHVKITQLALSDSSTGAVFYQNNTPTNITLSNNRVSWLIDIKQQVLPKIITLNAIAEYGEGKTEKSSQQLNL